MEVAIESVSMSTSVEGTTPAIAAAASKPDTLALAAQCPFIQHIVGLTGDAQAASNTLAPFMALANSTTAPRLFLHRARLAVTTPRSAAQDPQTGPTTPEPLHIPTQGAGSPAPEASPEEEYQLIKGDVPQQDESSEAKGKVLEPTPSEAKYTSKEGDEAQQPAIKEEASSGSQG
ncbi:hypothetical protein WJX75_000597 [Coccomyxa subellipsoidea]|uniref:Uncharacterized protein n=1 Tax=Coccomyxa subellipsoidea TaxID=248742 RepID=A0ABR2YCZ8_9CHLO